MANGGYFFLAYPVDGPASKAVWSQSIKNGTLGHVLSVIIWNDGQAVRMRRILSVLRTAAGRRLGKGDLRHLRTTVVEAVSDVFPFL